MLNKTEIDGYIFKTGRGKNTSFFVKSHLIDNNKNIVSDVFSTENNTVSPLQQKNLSSPVTVKSLRLLLTELTITQKPTPQSLAKLRHLQMPDEILFWNN